MFDRGAHRGVRLNWWEGLHSSLWCRAHFRTRWSFSHARFEQSGSVLSESWVLFLFFDVVFGSAFATKCGGRAARCECCGCRSADLVAGTTFVEPRSADFVAGAASVLLCVCPWVRALKCVCMLSYMCSYMCSRMSSRHLDLQ